MMYDNEGEQEDNIEEVDNEDSRPQFETIEEGISQVKMNINHLFEDLKEYLVVHQGLYRMSLSLLGIGSVS